MAVAQSFTFGPGGQYTASWDGVGTLTITLTSGGAFVMSLAGQSLAQLTSSAEFVALAAGGVPFPVAPLMAGNNLSDLVSAAAARTSLGLGSAALLPSSNLMQLVATTGAAGYTLVNGTGTIFTWTAPNDGGLHRVLLLATLGVTVAETGGQLQLAATNPAGNAASQSFLSAQGTGSHEVQFSVQVQAGTTVTLSQNTALTAGTAVLWADLLAA
jgi:hypothetical protein